MNNICASCEKEFQNTIVHYNTSGNYCSLCMARINILCIARIKLSKYGKDSEKLRPFLLELHKYGISVDYLLRNQSIIESLK